MDLREAYGDGRRWPAGDRRNKDLQTHPTAAPGGLDRRSGAKARGIGLIGNFGSPNLGNEGSMQAMLAFLRRVRPDAELLVICTNPETAQRTHDVASVPLEGTPITNVWRRRVNRLLLRIPSELRDFLRAYRTARRLGILITPGTGVFDDFSDRPGGMAYVLFKWCLAARLARCRIAFVSVGAGPISYALNRRLMRAAARLAQYRSYRDQASKDFMTEIGLDTSRDGVFPDIAFGLPRPQGAAAVAAAGAAPTIGVNVMNYWGWRPGDPDAEAIRGAYFDKMTDFIGRLIERGDNVRLLVGSLSDQSIVEMIAARVAPLSERPGAGRLFCTRARCLSDVLAEIGKSDAVVATRFHNIVCALKMGKPAISLGYADKNDALLADVGLAGFHQHCETFDVDRLCEQLEQLLRDRARFSAGIAAKVRLYEQALAAQEAELAANWL